MSKDNQSILTYYPHIGQGLKLSRILSGQFRGKQNRDSWNFPSVDFPECFGAKLMT